VPAQLVWHLEENHSTTEPRRINQAHVEVIASKTHTARRQRKRAIGELSSRIAHLRGALEAEDVAAERGDGGVRAVEPVRGRAQAAQEPVDAVPHASRLYLAPLPRSPQVDGRREGEIPVVVLLLGSVVSFSLYLCREIRPGI